MVRTVLVTGCSSGIGRATAAAFRDDGWRVYAATRDPDDLSPSEVGGATVVELDVTSRADAERVVERAVAETGRLDCLVNNAGYGQFGPLEAVPAESMRAQFDVNVFGPHRLVRAALPHMRERGTGTVVNVGSVDGRLPLAGAGAYCGSKSALAEMSAALRQEVTDHGVDVVLVEPGLVATEFFDRAVAELETLSDPDVYEDVRRVLERVGVFGEDHPGVAEPSAVADVVLGAANADAPEPRYQAGPLGRPGVLAAELLPRSWWNGAVRTAIALAASAPVQSLFEWADRPSLPTPSDADR